MATPTFRGLSQALGAPSYTLEEPRDEYERLLMTGLAPADARRRADMSEAMSRAAQQPSDQGVPTVSAPPPSAATTPGKVEATVTQPVAPKEEIKVAAPPSVPPSAPKPPPVPGAGGDDDLGRLQSAQNLINALETFGSSVAGRSVRTGIAENLGEQVKRIEALRAKRQEREEGLSVEKAQNEQALNAYQASFPELREELEPLRGQTGKPAFAGLLRDIVATRKAATGERALDVREKALAGTEAYRAGTLDLRRDIAKDTRDYRAVQTGLKQAELDLRREEAARKATGNTEPSAKERSTFQTMMKPAEQTAVSLKDADNLNSLSSGMLVSGKPPPFLTQADIVSFVGVPPFEGVMRSRLAKSNPQAFDLLTQMARLKTMVGHEYFGSALSPAEAERQRQFLDFGVTDTPESIARKMKSYHETLADKASVFLRPRVVNHPLGAEWTQLSGLDAITDKGGTFAGLLAAPATPAPRAVRPAAVPAPATASGRRAKPEGMVRVLHRASGQTATVSREKADEMLKASGFEEVP